MSLNHRKVTYYIDNSEEVDFCGEKIFQFIGGRYEVPFSIEATIGEHSLLNCDNCRSLQKKLQIEISKKLKKFPLCCDYHENLLTFKEFNKSDFDSIADSTASKILYVYHHIINNLDEDNWQKDIKDYIDYAIESHGSFPPNYGEPFQLGNFFSRVLELIDNSKNSMKSSKITDGELTERLKFVTNYIKKFKDRKGESKTDLNILYQTYEKWLKVFPFDLNTYFGNLKPQYHSRLPILNGNGEINKYLGTSTFELHTKESLIEVLLNITNNLLTQINGYVLYERGLITDTNKIKLELIVSNRVLELKKGYHNKSQTEEQRYRKILKKWFKDEKKFFNEITPLIAIPKPNINVVEVNLEVNKFEYVFSSDLGYTLFAKLHEHYKEDKKVLANYSFLYYAMHKDNLIISTGIDFIKFLSEAYNIHLDKMDSRQSGSVTRQKLYNAIKSSYSKKERL